MKRLAIKSLLAGTFVCGMGCVSVWAQGIVEGSGSGFKFGAIELSTKQDGIGVSTMDFQMIVADEAGNVNFFGSGGPPTFTLGGFGDMLASPVPGFGGDIMSMLSQPQVQRDLDLSDDQRNQINQLRQELKEKLSEHAQVLRDRSFNPADARNFGEVVRDLQKQQIADLEQILLPHQLRRLKEISFQSRMRNLGPTGVLSDKEIAEELGISPEQMKRIKEKAKELGRELKEKIERLREEAQRELFQELTRDQMEKLERMMGDRFEFPREQEIPERGGRFRQSVEGGGN